MADLDKLVKVIKSVKNEEQLNSALKYARLMYSKLNKKNREKAFGFEDSMRLFDAVQEQLNLKTKELDLPKVELSRYR